MSLATLSLAALLLALILSCTTAVNIGFLALVFAWFVALAGGMPAGDVIGAFPASLFLTLVGVTLLFSEAQVNGTLDRLTHRVVRRVSATPAAIPFVFFGLTALLSSIGPGNIAATALMAPLGMAAAGRYRIPAFLMAIMIANGASAGSVSPLAPTGVIVNDIAAKIGLPDARWTIYLNNFAAHFAVASAGYLLLGGWRMFRRAAPRPVPAAAGLTSGTGAPHAGVPARPAPSDAGAIAESGLHAAPGSGGTHADAGADAAADAALSAPLSWRHWLTCGVIAALIAGVIGFDLNVGLGALAGAVLLTLARATDEPAAIRAMPWNVIMMVSGVTTLVALVDRTGGMTLFAGFLGTLSTPGTATGVAAFFSGLISIYSSTTGVVLPALLPTIPDLIANIGGGDPMGLLSSMVIGGHLVDVSPLSTLGALCLAAAPAGTDTRRLFNQLMAWGLSMTVVGALVCWVLF